MSKIYSDIPIDLLDVSFMGRKLITMPDSLLASLRAFEEDHPEFNFSGFVQKQTAEMLKQIKEARPLVQSPT